MRTNVNASIFRFAFGTALNDATMQNAYNPATSSDTEKLWEKVKPKAVMRRIVVNLASDSVMEFAHDVLNRYTFKNQEDYDARFMALAEKIRDALSADNIENQLERTEDLLADRKLDSGEKAKAYKMLKKCGSKSDADEMWQFTFGNIQKLINMTMKYLFIGCYMDDGNRQCFQFCHCPMDSIMMKHVDDLRNGKHPHDDNMLDGFRKLYDEKRAGGRRRILFREVSWSQLKFSSAGSNGAYGIFQELIRQLAGAEGVNPLEYDFVHFGSRNADIQQ